MKGRGEQPGRVSERAYRASGEPGAQLSRRRRWTGAMVLFLVAFLAMGVLLGPAFAQRQRSRQRDFEALQLPPVDSEFVFARVQYRTTRGARGFRSRREGWAHDYPAAERHILEIAQRVTRIKLDTASYVIVSLDSPELFEYPFAYFSEVGQMQLTEREAANFREYLDRGGFAVVDDFDGGATLAWFQRQMGLVHPGRYFLEMKVDDPLFHNLYDIETLDVEPPYPAYGGPAEPPRFYGYYDDRGRLTMIVNHNNDIGDFWEWLDEPIYPLQSSMVGVHLGINYMVYSMSH